MPSTEALRSTPATLMLWVCALPLADASAVTPTFAFTLASRPLRSSLPFASTEALASTLAPAL
ncbi:antifreeze glycoprotein polyprotein [Stigmatella aurantiaca DW4/3-1]|uniref:Antifreeze glycoprotein polyprotein n=1 Tax=Stigmatella aurantiaca (strain DW4/3-1) TaxID=378806 RepID=Q091Z2_STIAD|nr:antifreeze glycoprotein polyprotein [Stigmatella aurantiaca DW4/3-1]